MKLDRNLNGDGRGKYGLVNNRELIKRADEAKACVAAGGTPSESELEAMKVVNAVSFLEAMGVIDWGEEGTESEFFVIKLRDRHAHKALSAYSRSVSDHTDDVEYAEEVLTLAHRSGPYSPFCKSPD
ncbi:hypothetical protein [Bradyrhizobium japonicum]|uniref:hypothetical protein n=1 Tax=Bradyrhizobium japonicum TaxID=375 RepID=UPI003515C404